jgi:hypothetical protein
LPPFKALPTDIRRYGKAMNISMACGSETSFVNCHGKQQVGNWRKTCSYQTSLHGLGLQESAKSHPFAQKTLTLDGKKPVLYFALTIVESYI